MTTTTDRATTNGSAAESSAATGSMLRTDPKTTVIHGNLVLDKDTVYDGPLTVEGSVLGKDGERFHLTVNGDIDAWDITARDIKAQYINAWDITARDIKARDITAGNINAWNITAKGNISASDISARDIDARDINARNITAKGNISASDISAWDITARDINARDINARDIDVQGKISYYALCFAYQNIRCKSITGEHEKHRHFALDGKVIVNGKEESE